jgi:uncharacterized membrane protein
MLSKRGANILIIVTIALSLFTLVIGFSGSGDLICPKASCEELQKSSFGRLFGVPLGAYAAALLSFVLLLRFMRKEQVAAAILWAMLGVETYLTFISFTYLGTFCFICMIFLLALGCCVALTSNTLNITAGVFSASLFFFIGHFVFFYPDAHIKPTLMNDTASSVHVEVFASPTCTHCEEALSTLRKISTDTNISLSVRPVSLGNKQAAIDWVEEELFTRQSATARRFAEKLVWENEREARNLAGGKLIVPIIRVRRDGEERVFCGWNDQVEKHVVSNVKGISLAQAEVQSANGDTCTANINCSEPLPFWGTSNPQALEIN